MPMTSFVHREECEYIHAISRISNLGQREECNMPIIEVNEIQVQNYNDCTLVWVRHIFNYSVRMTIYSFIHLTNLKKYDNKRIRKEIKD